MYLQGRDYPQLQQDRLFLPMPTLRSVAMSQQDAFDQALESLHKTLFDEANMSATMALIEEACGTTGNDLVVGAGQSRDRCRIIFGRFFYRGERRQDQERTYFGVYHPLDERVPRLRQLPDGHIVHVSELYTAQELIRSPSYNEALHRGHAQNGLNIRLDGPDGSRIIWVLRNPIDPGGWGSAQTGMVESLLPHLRHFVHARQALVNAGALGASLFQLFDNTRFGVIHLNQAGRMEEANDTARRILRRGDGLYAEGGSLRARLRADNARFEELLARALPSVGVEANGASMTVSRSPGMTRLAVHIAPVRIRQKEFDDGPVAVLVLVVEPGSQTRVAPEVVAATLGLTPAESRVAVFLTEGQSIRQIAELTGRKESSIRSHLKRIYSKREITRQADLVRLVLSVADLSPFER